LQDRTLLMSQRKVGEMFVPKGAQHDQHPTNQAVDKMGIIPGAQ